MIQQFANRPKSCYVSLAIFAWNEERAIKAAIQSLSSQNLFAHLSERGLDCEVLCICNGCTDRTPVVAAEEFEELKRSSSGPPSFNGQVVNILKRGKLNAWNQFVHRLSAKEARYMVMMDADILLHGPATLWNMLQALEGESQAHVAVDRPCKDLLFKGRRSFRDCVSLATSRMTLSASAQLCAQLYCMRAEVARKIYLPKDLPACEDGFIKQLVCTDFLTHEVWPERIRVADEAEHIFEAYTSPRAILKNQKRQIIGQTIVHLLVDRTLKAWPSSQREHLAETLKARDQADPDWLKRLLAEHLNRTHCFWRLYPNLLSHSWRGLQQLRPLRRIAFFPAAVARFGAELVSSFMAYRSLRSGCINYWPKAERLGLKPSGVESLIAGDLRGSAPAGHTAALK